MHVIKGNECISPKFSACPHNFFISHFLVHPCACARVSAGARARGCERIDKKKKNVPEEITDISADSFNQRNVRGFFPPAPSARAHLDHTALLGLPLEASVDTEPLVWRSKSSP